MAYSLEVWIAQQLREVGEDGSCASRIVLRSVDNGTPWQTWNISRTGEYRTEAPQLLEEIANVQNGLAEQFPTGKTQVVFIALDSDGVDLSRFPTSILGRNRSASAGNLIQNEAGQALSQTMLAFADTFRQVLGPVNAQFGLAMKHQEALQKTIIAQTEYITALLEQKVLEKQAALEEKAEDTSELGQQFQQHLPQILEIFQGVMNQKSAPRAASKVVSEVAQAVANGAKAPITGEN